MNKRNTTNSLTVYNIIPLLFYLHKPTNSQPRILVNGEDNSDIALYITGINDVPEYYNDSEMLHYTGDLLSFSIHIELDDKKNSYCLCQDATMDLMYNTVTGHTKFKIRYTNLNTRRKVTVPIKSVLLENI